MYNIGQKVRIHKDRIDEFWNDPDRENWVEEAEEIFASGAVFIITDIVDKYHVQINNGLGGKWHIDHIVEHHELPGDLFRI